MKYITPQADWADLLTASMLCDSSTDGSLDDLIDESII